MYDKNKDALADERMEMTARENAQVDPSHEGDDKLSRKTRSPRLFPWLLLVVGLCVGLMVGLYLRPLVMPEARAEAAPLVKAESFDEVDRSEMQQAVMEAVLAEVRHFEGDPNAPVKLVEFGDFKCGYCGEWNHETLPPIRDKYLESGKVRIAHVNYPILGPDSMASEAAECAAQQGRFWEYAQLLYENQRTSDTLESLIALAEGLELDTDTFEGCLADFPDKEALTSQIGVGQMLGVRGTPALLINEVPLSGTRPYEAFGQIIEALLDGEF
jgi:protein-disulfide isomerase